MEREEYKNSLKRITRSREFKGIRLPKEVYDFGWEIAKFKPVAWINEKVDFWLYAYDRSHVWTVKDFSYEVTDEAWERAKAKRKERRQQAQRASKQKSGQVIGYPLGENSWEECSGSLERTLKKLGVSSLQEAVFPNKKS